MLILVAALTLAPPNVTPEPQATAPGQVPARYRELFEQRDAEGLRELWLAHPTLILGTFDGDLERSLALWEKSPEASDAERIGALHERATWGARIASEATGRPIFADYAAAFIGWNDEQKLAFRAGQAAFGESRRHIQAAEFDAALESARECLDLALPLGDWWGTAMGYTAEGMALQAAGMHAEALVATGQARLLNAQLGLETPEYRNLLGLLAGLVELARWPRALVCANDAAALARRVNDEPGLRRVLGERARIERELGLPEAAAATEKELEALGD